jgi:hypothetical protein
MVIWNGVQAEVIEEYHKFQSGKLIFAGITPDYLQWRLPVYPSHHCVKQFLPIYEDSNKADVLVVEITYTVHWLYHSCILYTGSYMFRQ